jgi:hypothetical protein
LPLKALADFQPRQLTLKALASSSPGFALKPWVQNLKRFHSNSERVATASMLANGDAILSGLRLQEKLGCISPGFKANPGLKLANAFSVKLKGWN